MKGSNFIANYQSKKTPELIPRADNKLLLSMIYFATTFLGCKKSAMKAITAAKKSQPRQKQNAIVDT
jgi:hypothetical protein